MSPVSQYKRRVEAREEIHPWRWRILALWMLAFTAVVIALVISNRHRVNDIQHSRLVSCETFYENVEDVALFFFPPEADRTARQRLVASRLHLFLAKKIQGCKAQVKTTN